MGHVTKQQDSSQLIAISILEKIVNQLLVHRERDALRAGFVEVVGGYLKPQQLQLMSNEQYVLAAHRNQTLAEIEVFDMCSDLSEKIMLSGLADVHQAVETKVIQIRRQTSSQKTDLYVPLVSGNIVNAVLVLKGLFFTTTSQQVWQHILAAYQNLNEMMYLAEIDPLTGLMNRLTFDRLLNKSVNESVISGNKKTVHFALVDIDFFKKINDSFGHLYGDEVLVLLGRAMQHSFRSIDWLFRYGGEEFVVVLRSTTSQTAFQALERFRKTIEQMVFPQMEQNSVTISVGYSEMSDFDAVSSLVDRADHALYYAKNHGRNQVLCYEDLVEQGLIEGVKTQSAEIELF